MHDKLDDLELISAETMNTAHTGYTKAVVDALRAHDIEVSHAAIEVGEYDDDDEVGPRMSYIEATAPGRPKTVFVWHEERGWSYLVPGEASEKSLLKAETDNEERRFIPDPPEIAETMSGVLDGKVTSLAQLRCLRAAEDIDEGFERRLHEFSS